VQDQRKHAIVVISPLPPDEPMYTIVLMPLTAQGEIDWSNNDTFVLTKKRSQDEAGTYAIELAEIIRLKVLQIVAGTGNVTSR
jgi:hypothetical protein